MKNNQNENSSDLFGQFSRGSLLLPNKSKNFANLPWIRHPDFPGVELKHIITGEDTKNQYSFHLVRIAPNKEIGFHIHAAQLETHEVISGGGVCINQRRSFDYFPGIISFFPAGIEHKVTAGPDGCSLFAKFFPALC